MTNFSWLIEAPGLNYLSVRKLGKYAFFWTLDHNKALRFFSQEQADMVMMAVRESEPKLWAFAANLGEAKPVEYGWVSPAAEPDGERKPRYENVSCSNCGNSFGPGDNGFSHCDQHQPPEVWIPILIRNEFDKAPDLGKAGYAAFDREWDDGADGIARKIIDRFASLRARTQPELVDKEALAEILWGPIGDVPWAGALKDASLRNMVASCRMQADALLSALPSLGRPMPSLQTIETAPKTGDDLIEKCVLGYCANEEHPNDRFKVVWWEPKIKGGVWWSDADIECNPTHWQSLPSEDAILALIGRG